MRKSNLPSGNPGTASSLGLKLDLGPISVGTERYGSNEYIPSYKISQEHSFRITHDAESPQSEEDVKNPKDTGTGFNPNVYNIHDRVPVYNVGTTPSGGKVYVCTITGTIGGLYDYIGLLDCINNMKTDDVIELNINSPGGYISTATHICSAIRTCKGHVATHATGMCASAGSLIWSVGKSTTVGDTANFMWHMSSHFDMGNSISISKEAEYTVSYVRDILLSISLQRGFITEEEVNKICTNPDEEVWVSSVEMKERLRKFQEEQANV